MGEILWQKMKRAAILLLFVPGTGLAFSESLLCLRQNGKVKSQGDLPFVFAPDYLRKRSIPVQIQKGIQLKLHPLSIHKYPGRDLNPYSVTAKGF